MADNTKDRTAGRQVWVGDREHDFIEDLRARIAERYGVEVNKGVMFNSVLRHGMKTILERWGADLMVGLDTDILDEVAEEARFMRAHHKIKVKK